MSLWYDIKDRIFKHFFWQQRLLVVFISIGFIVNLIIWYIIAFVFRDFIINSEMIPLHYNIYIGPDNFGSFNELYTMPGLGLLILILNIVLGITLFQKNKLLSYYLIIGGSLMQVFLLWALILIMNFNK